MGGPRITRAQVDWRAVQTELAEIAPKPESGAADPFEILNSATSSYFERIADSPVPVLLPFDASTFLKDIADGTAQPSADAYLAGFHASGFFYPGPSGYDAVF